HVARAARVLVVPPGAAEVVFLVQDDEIVVPGLLQRDPHPDPAEPGSHDYDPWHVRTLTQEYHPRPRSHAPRPPERPLYRTTTVSRPAPRTHRPGADRPAERAQVKPSGRGRGDDNPVLQVSQRKAPPGFVL